MPRKSTSAVASADAPTAAAIDPDRIQHLDPRALILDLDANVRVCTEVDADLVESIREHGVQQPITAVLTADGRVRVETGHRRTLAALRAECATIPVRVERAEATSAAERADAVVRRSEENERRAGMTMADRVKVVVQLAALDMTPSQIARRTHRTSAEVGAALAVAGSDLAKAAVLRYDFLDFEQAAAVAEFEDDPETVKRLVVAARGGQFEHVLQRARDARETEARKAPVAASLRETGITVIRRAGHPTFQELHALVDAATREPLDVQEHATCPGHAAFIREQYPDDIEDVDQAEDVDDADQGAEEGEERTVMVPVFGCLDPHAHGHLYRWERSAPVSTVDERTPEQRAADEAAAKQAASAERADLLKSNKAWRSAEKVRRKWLRDLAARKSAPKGAAAFLASAIARDAPVATSKKGNHLAAKFLGLPKPGYGYSADVAKAIDAAPATRVQLLHLVLILAGYEAHTNVTDWRRRPATTGRYLAYIETCGYRLSPVEERALGRRDDLGD